MNFKKFSGILFEKNRKTRNLLPDSESKRKDRADNVKILKVHKFTPSTAPPDKPLLKGWKLYEVRTVSQEKTENREHTGYVVLDKNGNVKDVFCSCADFQFLWRYALNKEEMASWETYPEYKDVETYAPHTRKPSHKTNPNFDRKLCKHLIKIFDLLNI